MDSDLEKEINDVAKRLNEIGLQFLRILKFLAEKQLLKRLYWDDNDFNYWQDVKKKSFFDEVDQLFPKLESHGGIGISEKYRSDFPFISVLDSEGEVNLERIWKVHDALKSRNFDELYYVFSGGLSGKETRLDFRLKLLKYFKRELTENMDKIRPWISEESATKLADFNAKLDLEFKKWKVVGANDY